MGDHPHGWPGSPIRTPSDHSSFGSSPRPFAAYHVLHRLLVPRHPPCALKNLATKMLASTVQISNTHQHPLVTEPPDHRLRDAMWTPRGDPALKTTTARTRRVRARLFLQDPTACDEQTCDVPPMSAGMTTIGSSAGRLCASATRGTTADPPMRARRAERLLRKEVIQPHLPVRLPCYDFVPIAGPTFDGSLHKGWVTGFG